MIIKKLIYAMNIVIIMSILPMQASIWKYFTTAYWLPYTCGKQLELDQQKEIQDKQKALQKEISKYNEDKLINNLKDNDLCKLNDQKINRLTTKINRLTKLQTNIFSTAYWLPYTCGKQLKIDHKTSKRKQLIEKNNQIYTMMNKSNE